MMAVEKNLSGPQLSFKEFKKEVLQDYKIAIISRACSYLGRKEVLTGKAKFGIFGDGKELPQLAMAKAFKKGDFRSGYYRDQTFMMAIGALTPKNIFSALYAHSDIQAEPMSAGRQMGGHFSTHSLHENGEFKNLANQYNSSSDVSPTGSQMPRMLGLAQASKIYRHHPEMADAKFSNSGNEISWGTIGDASTSEGVFFETINAAGVLQVPFIINVWDDQYGISVPNKLQTTKESISEALSGFQQNEQSAGFEILTVKGWDYPTLTHTYHKAAKIAREQHIPVLIHVEELTQPQGHSTSGSHERYKTAERLEWETAHDCLAKMRQWILDFELEDEDGQPLRIVTQESELIQMEKEAEEEALKAKNEAWEEYINPIKKNREELAVILQNILNETSEKTVVSKFLEELMAVDKPFKKDLLSTARKILVYIRNEDSAAKTALQNWVATFQKIEQPKYSDYLHTNEDHLKNHENLQNPVFNENADLVDGRIVLRNNFDALLSKHSNLLIFGEDSGKIGDVNQGLSGLQDKFGEHRVADTGIREASIMGQGIGMAMRGLRPIAEIQYLDYLLYALQILSDDLATVHYRSAGKQKAPLIIRTRGHRLEGVWHSGSPMGGIIHFLRGIYVLVPRNLTKAAGFYNALLQSDQPALVVEPLNGYRLKEKEPLNYGEFKTPIGVVEVVKKGVDLTVLSYGSTLRIVQEIAPRLNEVGIDIEIIDAQSLLPFDVSCDTVKSVEKTNRLLVVDEDVPGGASSYLLNEVLDRQDAYQYLDSKPTTLTAKAHRPAYGTDGDYFSKPSAEDIFEKIYEMMQEVDPTKYPKLFS